MAAILSQLIIKIGLLIVDCSTGRSLNGCISYIDGKMIGRGKLLSPCLPVFTMMTFAATVSIRQMITTVLIASGIIPVIDARIK